MSDDKDSLIIQKLQHKIIEMSMAYDATIEGFGRAMDLREKEAEGHIQRVTEMTVQLAMKMAVSDTAILHIRRGAYLHDVGKMGIPDVILQKPGALNKEEMALVRMHPQYAYELLLPIPYLFRALDIPYRHHEKWDGSGYPGNLRNEQIPLAARIFAVVDVYDALTSNRPYRQAWTKENAIEHIKKESGTHFDPQVVEAFLSLQVG